VRAVLIAFLLVACSAIAAAQAPSSESSKPKNAPKTLTISGCVAGDETMPGAFTLSDSKEGTTYRLTGTNVRGYANQRVQIAGSLVQPRLKITGGLVPSPNVAAQAGAMDPVQAAMAGAGGSANASSGMPLPEFRVKSVRPIAGSCPQR
jgi:hypothetical protein